MPDSVGDGGEKKKQAAEVIQVLNPLILSDVFLLPLAPRPWVHNQHKSVLFIGHDIKKNTQI